jgi:hypothetical protein
VRRVANDEMGMDDILINAIWLAVGDRFSWAGLMSIVQSTKFVRATALYCWGYWDISVMPSIESYLTLLMTLYMTLFMTQRHES